ncbi:MAG: HDOD domain-containing protein [Campylobacterales bacterium]|nr:HDOD domain-containing protein [Campylobacterales bacterium]
MENVRIGRQPILDSQETIVSYALMYREVLQNKYSSASLISNVLNKFGTETLLGDKRAFVTVEEKFLLHDLILTIPGEFFILSLASDVKLSERVIERVELLHKKGFLLSIEHLDFNLSVVEEYELILHCLSFVKIDIRKDMDASVTKIISDFKRSGITVVGDNIYDSVLFEKAKALGCDWFEGYFFAELKIVENAKYEASYMQVLKLYRLLMDDVNIDEITKEFENNHEITLQLLQFINSGAFHFRRKISSIHHVLVLVGRIPLAQWLMLMIYSKSITSKHQKTPLMLMVKNRTELMEGILKTLRPDVRSNMLGEAYFVGVLSLIDRVFSMQLKDVLKHIHISEEVEQALLKYEGIMGEILELIVEIEQFNTDAAIAFEKKHGLKQGQLNDIVLASIQNVQAFESPKELED